MDFVPWTVSCLAGLPRTTSRQKSYAPCLAFPPRPDGCSGLGHPGFRFAQFNSPFVLPEGCLLFRADRLHKIGSDPVTSVQGVEV